MYKMRKEERIEAQLCISQYPQSPKFKLFLQEGLKIPTAISKLSYSTI
jgi:hypothetical protein